MCLVYARVLTPSVTRRIPLILALTSVDVIVIECVGGISLTVGSVYVVVVLMQLLCSCATAHFFQ